MEAIAESATADGEVVDRSDATGSIDRGYTSDSELYENRVSRSASAPGASGVHGSSPELNVPVGGGGWIFVGRQGEIEHLKGKQAPGREYNIVHDRKLVNYKTNDVIGVEVKILKFNSWLTILWLLSNRARV